MSESEVLPWRCAVLISPPNLLRPIAEYLSDRWLVCTASLVPYLVEHGRIPEAVIGPLAALDETHRARVHAAGSRLLMPADGHMQTALELALNYAITIGARDILLLGLVVDSLAESLGNLLLLARAEWGGARLTFVHGQETGYLLRHGEAAVIESAAGDNVVLLPLSPKATEIVTQGLEPPMRNVHLELGRIAHLTVVEPPARVWLGAGRLLVLHRPGSPPPLVT